MNLINELKSVLFIFSRTDKQKIFLVVLIQILLSILDLIGVAIFGIIGTITVYGIQSKATGFRVTKILEFFNLLDWFRNLSEYFFILLIY